MKINTAGVAALTAGCFISTCSAFCVNSHSHHTSTRLHATTKISAVVTDGIEDLTFTPPDTKNEGQISEQACNDAASLMKRVNVPVPDYVSSTGAVGVSYIHWPTRKSNAAKNSLPLLLVHGFDSSCLEYRRLGPKLAELGIETYAVDLLGWGYTQLNKDVKSFSAQAKVDALAGFWETVGKNREVCVVGASLGGAAAIEFGSTYADVVKGAIFIDAQGFVDGIGPAALLPNPLAKLGVKVLKSVPLRSSANQMSYFDPETYATDDALKVGRFHCLQEGWDDALVSFMQSGGFSPSKKIEKIGAPSLVLWGRQDGILNGEEFANKFLETLPDAELKWIEECGHVPHLEQPDETARTIAEFLYSDKFEGLNGDILSSTPIISIETPDIIWGVGGLAGAAAVAGAAGAFIASN